MGEEDDNELCGGSNLEGSGSGEGVISTRSTIINNVWVCVFERLHTVIRAVMSQ
jgi:hypothetical protein